MAGSDVGSGTVTVKRGDEIFAGTDYPRTWAGFVGQTEAIEQLRVALASAIARSEPMEHTLLSSGVHGIGKTTLGHLLAAEAGVGILETTGPLDVEDAEEQLMSMQDGDIWFVDEAHLLVYKNRRRADWLLPWMTEGKLYTRRGPIQTPRVTLVAATTDAGVLPMTLLSRFMVEPHLVPYTSEEATEIALNLADRMGVDLVSVFNAEEVATAADSNPRTMRKILSAIRDLNYALPESHPNLAKAFKYAGVSGDGLSQIARDILLVLLTNPDYTGSIDFIGAALGEPGPLKHHEQQLLQRGMLTITGRGRALTKGGVERGRAEFARRMRKD